MKKAIYLSAIVSQLSFLALLPIYLKLFAYLHPVVILVVWLCQTILFFFVVFYIKQINIKLPIGIFKVLLVLYSLCLLTLLFIRPTEQNYQNYNLLPFATISFYLSGEVSPLVAVYNLVANVGLFIPYGIFLLTKKRSKIQLVMIPLTFIALIELAQLVTHRGSLDIDDLLLNLIGVFIGYLLYPVFRKVVNII